ncbi:aminopeptidase [Spartobacteria bacterium LR76]|nr:aminopeptidase [Spartobacteria bacterium LR76]
MIGHEIHSLARRLWSIDRSITGDGVRETLGIIKDILPSLEIHEIPSGTQVYDWTVPREWKVLDAFIIDPTGKKICDFQKNNLHLVGYSTPVNARMSLAELQEHLYSLPEQPTAIPYITSYYKERWGFCISQQERDALIDGEYKVVVDSELFNGSLTYGELLIKGKSQREVFLSTYVCHPSMANNELSGPTVATFLADWLTRQKGKRFSYRFVFIPETIGSIAYLSRNLGVIKPRVFAGFNISCVGDDRDYSYLPSRTGDTLSDRVAKHILSHIYPDFKSYRWTHRGSDERQYCAPGIDLPIASIMRTKYGMYPEYHTSLDDLENVVTPEGLEGGYTALYRALEAIEHNIYPRVNVLCEPQLGKRGLYPTLSTKSSGNEVRCMMNLISYSDGTKSLLEIAELCECPVWELYPLVEKLTEHHVLILSDDPQVMS